MRRCSLSIPRTAKGDASLSFFSGRVRAAYVLGNETGYFKPMVDLDAMAIRRSGFQESDAGPAGLDVRGQTETPFSVAPAVEVGAQFAAAGSTLLRPFLRAGVRVFGKEDLTATATLIGAPAGVSGFTVTTPIDSWMGEIAASLEIMRNDRFDARIGYEGRFGERTTQHGGSVKLRAKF